MKDSNTFLRGNPNVKVAKATEYVTKQEYVYRVKEIIKCKKDIIYFANTYYTIIGDNGKEIIQLYEKQAELVKCFQNNKNICTLASRQSGKSTAYCIYLLWYALFNEDKSMLICANKESTALSFISRIKMAYELIPNWLKPGIEVDGWNKKSIKFGNGCSITGLATSSDSARGFSCDILVLDEIAFVPNNIIDEFWQSVYPIISAKPNGQIIMVSTPNGAQGLFYETYEKATLKMNSNAWVPFRIDWWDRPGRDDKWKKQILDELNNDMRKFAQEFGNAFHGSSYTLIPGKLTKQYKEYIAGNNNEPKIKYLDKHKLHYFNEWYNYSKNRTYVIGADTGEGIGSDYSTILVFDITNTTQIRLVASYADNTISPSAFGYVLAKMGALYNNAYIVMENNGVSKSAIDSLYINYEYENIVTYGSKDLSRIGILSHNDIKVDACLWLRDFITNSNINIIIDDAKLIYEMNWFERKIPSHKPVYQAVAGKNDDYMMSFIWAMYALTTKLIENYYIVEKYFVSSEGIEIPHIIKNVNDPYYIDNDFSSGLLPSPDKIDDIYENSINKHGNTSLFDDYQLAMNMYHEEENTGWINI
jgi:hypothetical protein